MTKKEIKYELDFTSKFKKDVKLLKKQGKNIEKLYEIINILACGEELDAKYRDHNLIGNYKGYRECHIESDWLLIYKIMENILILTLQEQELIQNYLKSNYYIKNYQAFYLIINFTRRGFYGIIWWWK